jgi:hypothetical protein
LLEVARFFGDPDENLRHFCALNGKRRSISCRFDILIHRKFNRDWHFLEWEKYFSTDAMASFDEKKGIFREKTVFGG